MSHLDQQHALRDPGVDSGIITSDHSEDNDNVNSLSLPGEKGPDSSLQQSVAYESSGSAGIPIASSVEYLQPESVGTDGAQSHVLRSNNGMCYAYGPPAMHVISAQGMISGTGAYMPPNLMHAQFMQPTPVGSSSMQNISTSLNGNVVHGHQDGRHVTTNSSNLSLSGDPSIPSQYMQMPPRNTSIQHQIPNQPMHSFYMQNQVAQSGLSLQQLQPNCPLPGQSTVLKPWHNVVEHRPLRDMMSEEIVKLLKSRRPNANDNWHEKLPQMAKRLEEALYREANNFEEYENKTTLKQRLQHLAVVMGGNKSSQQPQHQHRINGTTPRAPSAQSNPTYVMGQPMGYNPVTQQMTPQPQSHQFPTLQRPVSGAPQQYAPLQQQGMVMSNQPNISRSLHTTMDFHQQGMRIMPAQLPQMMPDPSQSFMQNYTPQSILPPSSYGQSETDMHFMNGNMMAQRSMAGSEKPIGATGPPTEDHRKQVLKQQQQRLLLLRHASKCPHEHGRCPVTPHCWSMKQLWKHIMNCKDQDCKIPHCVSSRYVLSHYSKCKDGACPVCGPVREAIKRNYLKSQQIIQGHPPTAPPIEASPPTAIGSSGKPSKKAKHQDIDGAVVVPAPTIKVPPPKPKSVYPLDPISCAIYCFTNQQIQSHFKTIQEGLRLTVAKIKEMCKPVIEELFKIPHVYNIFGMPVDPIQLGIPDYHDVIKFPMDLGTVMKKLDAGSYRDLQNFQNDVHLTFNNAMTFNPEKSDVHVLAKNLKKDFDSKFKKRVDEFDRMIENNRKQTACCLICGESSLKFEPPVYYCNGPCCQKIKRNSTYYCFNNNYHWCSSCFNQIKDQVEVRLPDVTFKVSELVKKKHNEESEDPWVECDGGCKRWIHQVCGLFNHRRNVSDDVAYVCPVCLQEKRKKSPEQEIVAPTTKKMRASDLPRTTLSEFIEKRILKRLQIAYEDYAENLGIAVEDVEKCPELTLRQVSCLDKLQIVRDGVHNRYKDKCYPADFPCRTKCLVLFQNIDGQDVILFGMYVYEYGHRCPQPNQRRVYISYLDSVHYLRPKQFRTLVYHEILISYLDYVKARGFHTAHIWACPPQKGDDYILYVHPADQKTPKPQTLRVWYDEMLKRCMERGVVVEVTDLHTEFLANPSNEVTVLPYFEGDYWVNEAEVIIKNLREGNSLDSTENEPGKSKRRSKAKRTSQTSIAASTCRVERDPVMAKLASIIEPMKDTFFVARLHPKEFVEKFANVDLVANESAAAEEAQRKEQELQEEALSGQDIVPTMPHPEVEDDDEFAKAASAIGRNGSSSEINVTDAMPSSHSSMDIAESKDDLDTTLSNGVVDQMTRQSDVESKIIMFAPAAETKREDRPRTIMCGEDMPNLPDDTEDVDDVMESEHFETRQQFLNLCQGNHYQFDQLRRAKHSSMMVLYHLHNPDAPKFVPTCSSCSMDILSGYRHNCNKCEVDFCQACVQARGTGIHLHPLRPIAIGATAPALLTEEQRRERQRSIQLHMQLLTHASNCAKCTSNNCAKMKDFLLHERTCKEKKNGCRLCARVSNLLNIHARSCRNDNCRVPQCSVLKSLHRQNALRQQQMDDRRRQQMNSEYGRSSGQEEE